jgi:hypothetical protein
VIIFIIVGAVLSCTFTFQPHLLNYDIVLKLSSIRTVPDIPTIEFHRLVNH